MTDDKNVQLEVTKATYTRILQHRKGFESADVVLNGRLDLADLAEEAQSTPLGMLGVKTIARADIPKPKPATTAELIATITTVLQQHGGEASNVQVVAEAAILLPGSSAHPNFKSHVSWAASAMRSQGLLHNGHDHAAWGLWRLVTPPTTSGS